MLRRVTKEGKGASASWQVASLKQEGQDRPLSRAEVAKEGATLTSDARGFEAEGSGGAEALRCGRGTGDGVAEAGQVRGEEQEKAEGNGKSDCRVL